MKAVFRPPNFADPRGAYNVTCPRCGIVCGSRRRKWAEDYLRSEDHKNECTEARK